MKAIYYKNNKVREIQAQFFDRNKDYTLIVSNLGENKEIAKNDLFCIYDNYYRVLEVNFNGDTFEKLKISLEKVNVEA